MAENSEHEASTSGQDAEAPENQAAPEPTQGGYIESEDHVPDPTALTGTLETSGTGGGVHERLTGTTRIFGDVEDVAQRVESLINERTQSLKEEVRGLLLQQETSARMANIPQQTVEEHGLPTHRGNVVAPHDDSGVAKDSNRAAYTGTSSDDVDGGIRRVEDPAQGDSYNQQTIAGAKNPNEPVEKAKEAQEEGATEPKESEHKDFEQAAKEYEKQLDDVVSGKTPAKKTTTSRRTRQQDKK